MLKVLFQRFRKIQNNQDGSIFLEFLLVIIIIAILAAIVIPSYTAMQNRNKEYSTEDKMKQVVTSLEIYNSDNGLYPLTEDFPSMLIESGYLKEEQARDAWGNNFQYICEEGNVYVLRSYGADGEEGGGDDIVFKNGKMIEDGVYPNK
ncbi:MAG: type II secretion system protein GspG [Actinobacteria bacterium]|nr:type II secretion system protein GspG [Actinomycetota bacterium]